MAAKSAHQPASIITTRSMRDARREPQNAASISTIIKTGLRDRENEVPGWPSPIEETSYSDIISPGDKPAPDDTPPMMAISGDIASKPAAGSGEQLTLVTNVPNVAALATTAGSRHATKNHYTGSQNMALLIALHAYYRYCNRTNHNNLPGIKKALRVLIAKGYLNHYPDLKAIGVNTLAYHIANMKKKWKALKLKLPQDLTSDEAMFMKCCNDLWQHKAAVVKHRSVVSIDPAASPILQSPASQPHPLGTPLTALSNPTDSSASGADMSSSTPMSGSKRPREKGSYTDAQLSAINDIKSMLGELVSAYKSDIKATAEYRKLMLDMASKWK